MAHSTTRSKPRWSKTAVTHIILWRQRRGLPLNYTAVVEDDEPLTGAALRLFGTWDGALKSAQIDPEAVKNPVEKLPYGTWDSAKVLSDIQTRIESEQSLAAHDVQKSNGKLYAAACKCFGSWREAVERAGVSYRTVRRTQEWSPERVISTLRFAHQEGADISDRTLGVIAKPLYGAIRTHFGSLAAACRASKIDYKEVRRTKHWAKSDVLDIVRKAAELNCSLHVVQEFAPRGFFQALLRFFGNVESAYNAAGVDPGRSGNRTRERVYCRLRDFRKEKGISQTEIGDLVGLSHRAIGLYEHEDGVPELAAALRIAEFLGVAVGRIWTLRKPVE